MQTAVTRLLWARSSRAGNERSLMQALFMERSDEVPRVAVQPPTMARRNTVEAALRGFDALVGEAPVEGSKEYVEFMDIQRGRFTAPAALFLFVLRLCLDIHD